MTVFAITMIATVAILYLLVAVVFVGMSFAELSAKRKGSLLAYLKAAGFSLFWPVTLALVLAMAPRVPRETADRVPIATRSISRA